MQINSSDKQHLTLENSGSDTSDLPSHQSSNSRKAFDQQRLRTDQVRLLQRQAITELVISVLVSIVVKEGKPLPANKPVLKSVSGE